MPVKERAPKRGRPRFTTEAIDLFAQLEAAPARQRQRQDWKDGSKRLHGLLNLSSEWWMAGDVCDRSSSSCYPPEMPAHTAWRRCREIRLQILAAIKEREERARRPPDNVA